MKLMVKRKEPNTKKKKKKHIVEGKISTASENEQARNAQRHSFKRIMFGRKSKKKRRELSFYQATINEQKKTVFDAQMKLNQFQMNST